MHTNPVLIEEIRPTYCLVMADMYTIQGSSIFVRLSISCQAII